MIPEPGGGALHLCCLPISLNHLSQESDGGDFARPLKESRIIFAIFRTISFLSDAGNYPDLHSFDYIKMVIFTNCFHAFEWCKRIINLRPFQRVKG